MARNWTSVRVELLGWHGEELWPPPGRILAVGPRHTFADLAAAIDDAFARWDRAHLCEFLLADGRRVTDEETADELAGSPDGPLEGTALLLDKAKTMRTVEVAEEFAYVFDFGDRWTHRCTMGADKIDPLDQLGVVPDKPVPMWGWGSIPDQYGRRWEDDTGEQPVPPRPASPHPMLSFGWPQTAPARPVALAELRGATYRGDVDAILAAIEGRDVDPCLQHVGTGVWVLRGRARDRAEGIAVSVVGQLRQRQWEGDELLAEELLAELRRTQPLKRDLVVDLTEVSYWLEGDAAEPSGLLDLQTGEVLPDFIDDPAIVGEDAAVDVDEDPDRWLALDRLGSRPGWHDMADFAAQLRDEPTRSRLEASIEGRGAFRRFRDEVDRAGLGDRWRTFSDDRKLGRAREHLAALGVRAVPPAARLA